MKGDTVPRASDRPESPWRLLLRLRWPLGAAIGLTFALGRLTEAVLLAGTDPDRMLIVDMLAWGALGGLAVWIALTWVSRQERHYQAELEQALREQQDLNRQLQRANSHLALLSDVNRSIADSVTLDETLNAALDFPWRLMQPDAAALCLEQPSGAVLARVKGATVAEITQLREALAVAPPAPDRRAPYVATTPDHMRAGLVVPLHTGQQLVGWIELYGDRTRLPSPDEQELLQTIGSEIAEAVVGARRRSREERAIYELERAIVEERARIARDIHDGLAQALAFRRMRIDLWLDWLETDRERLRAELIESKHILREQIQELRRAIFALRPVPFDELGFVGGLQRYIVEFAGQFGWTTAVDLGRAPQRLTPQLEAICFRVVQEGLTNAAKHARPQRVDVMIAADDHRLHVRLADDGVGFDPEQEAAGDHVGLRQMRERVAAVGGTLQIDSAPGRGTTIDVWLPLVHDSGNDS